EIAESESATEGFGPERSGRALQVRGQVCESRNAFAGCPRDLRTDGAWRIGGSRALAQQSGTPPLLEKGPGQSGGIFSARGGDEGESVRARSSSHSHNLERLRAGL